MDNNEVCPIPPNSGNRIIFSLPAVIHRFSLHDDPIQDPYLLNHPLAHAGEEMEIQAALESMITQAASNRMTTTGVNSPLQLVQEFKYLWRISLRGGPPASFPPIIVTIKRDAPPIRARVRRYPPEHKEFMHTFVQSLVTSGLVY